MSGRTIVSYEDITLPYHPPAKRPKPTPSSSTRRPPTEEPASSKSSGEARGTNRRAGAVETSRELTHDEIWDDSALIGAWDAAMEEYEAFNGPGKDWKQEVVFKSPLWYNKQPSRSSASNPTTNEEDEAVGDHYDDDAEDESGYANTEAQPYAEADHWQRGTDGTGPAFDPANSASVPMVSRDEAFSRALNAMYWGGYWTAMYHSQRNSASNDRPASEKNDDAPEDSSMHEETRQ